MISRGLVFCFTCDHPTRWRWYGCSNGNQPRIDIWLCAECGRHRMQMGDPKTGVTDAEALCINVLEDRMRRNGRGDGRFDYDDALGHLRVELYALYGKFDGRGTFLGYATSMLPRRLEDYYRSWLGRSEPKPLAMAESLDELKERANHRGGAARSGSGRLDRGGEPSTDATGRGLGSPVGSGAVDSDEHRPADLLRAVASRGSRLARANGGVGVEAAQGAGGGDQVAAAEAS